MIKVPKEIIEKFENASEGLDYGDITLRLSIKQGKPRYLISKEESIIPTEESISKELRGLVK